MRPALLVVIMDFLVSSLLLFVSGPGEGGPGVSGRRPGSPPASAPDLAGHCSVERLWQAQYQEQFREMRCWTSNRNWHAPRTPSAGCRNCMPGWKGNWRTARLNWNRSNSGARRRKPSGSPGRGTSTPAGCPSRNPHNACRIWTGSRRPSSRSKGTDAGADRRRGRREHAPPRRRHAQPAGSETELDHQVAGLRGRLQAQAETIGAQHRTIASQQEVIDQSSRMSRAYRPAWKPKPIY